MIEIEIPGREQNLKIEHLVLDYNGTIARDGRLLPEAAERITRLAEMVHVYVLTADTYGNVRKQCQGLGAEIRTFPKAGAALFKEQIVKELGAGVCAVGNGFNDIPMCRAAEISFGIMEAEGICTGLIGCVDVLVSSPADALDLLLKPDRLRATLRS